MAEECDPFVLAEHEQQFGGGAVHKFASPIDQCHLGNGEYSSGAYFGFRRVPPANVNPAFICPPVTPPLLMTLARS